MSRDFLSFCLALGLMTFAGALPPPGPPTRISVKVYRDLDGLPQNTVWALTRDLRGMLWAGTLHGIARYDGRSWRPMPTPVPPASLLVNPTAAACLSDGRICFGTRSHGLLIFQGGRWTRVTRAEGLPSDNVNAILESRRRGRDGNRIVWAGTYGGGLARLEEGRWQALPREQGPPTGRVFCLAEHPNAAGDPELWAGTDAGAWILGPSGGRPASFNARLPDPRIRTMAARVGDGGTPELWFGLEEGGVGLWRGGDFQLHGPGEGLPGGTVHAFSIDDGGDEGPSLWAAVDGQGVYRFRKGAWSPLDPGMDPVLRFARCLVALGLPQGPRVLWIGTEGKGLARHVQGTWEQLAFPDPAADARVLRILADRRGDLWLSTQAGGLWRFSGGRWARWTREQGLPHNTVRDLAWVRMDGKDVLVAATHGGLAFLDGARWKPFPEPFKDPGTFRTLLAPSRLPGIRLLVGTSRGLLAWDGRTWSQLGREAGLSNLSVRCLAEGGEGSPEGCFLGTDGGLFRFDGRRFEACPLPERLSKVGISSLLWWRGNGPGRLVLGSYGAGLALYEGGGDPAGTRVFPGGNDGSPEGDAVLSLQQDGRGRIYAGTLRGILRVRLDGSPPERFTEEDGLPGRECTQGQGAVDGAGRIWIGTAGGPVMLDPAEEREDRQPKPLHLLDVRCEGLSDPILPGQLLPPGGGRLSFEFALVAHHRERDTRYRSQLAGFEAEATGWSAEGRREFTGLGQGSYRFLVWGRDHAGNPSGPVEFPFRVRPPWWATWWARSLALMAAAGMVWGGFRWRSRLLWRRNLDLERLVFLRTREVQEQKEALEALTEDLVTLNIQRGEFLGIVAHDLRNPINQISLCAELALEEGGEPQAHTALSRILDSAGRMGELLGSLLSREALEFGHLTIHGLRQPLWPLLSACAESFRERAERKGQRIHLSGEQDVEAWVDPDRFREVLENLVSNALKFSPPGAEVDVRVHGQGAEAFIQVADQGPGIPAEERDKLFRPHARLSPRPTQGEPSTGLGLSITKRLVEAMGGKVWVDCLPTGGSTFTVSLRKEPPPPKKEPAS